MNVYDFDERLQWSKAIRQESDLATLQAMFPRATSVRKTGEAEDRAGTDYIITLRRGAELRVDAKARDTGCSKHWRDGTPDVALEMWSVCPGRKYETSEARKRIGWALDESKEIDLILYTFDPADHRYAYVRPFPLLRQAFWQFGHDWRFKTAYQDNQSRRYESQCMFVPLPVLDEAIEAVSRALLTAGG